MPDSPTDTSSTSPADESASLLARVARRASLVVAVLFVMIGSAVVSLQFDTVGTFVAQQAVKQFNPLPGTHLSVGTAQGSWLQNLLLTDVRLTRVDSTTGDTLEMARIDTVAARYRLASLLRNGFHLTDLTVAAPSVTMRQAPDSTWDWARVLDFGSDTTSSDFRFRLDDAIVRRGGWKARFHVPEGDSVVQAMDVQAHLRDLETGGEAFQMRLDTLSLRGRAPGDTVDLRLQTRASLTADRFRLDTLRLRSPTSHVDAGGRIRRSAQPADTLRPDTLRPDTLPAVRIRADAAPLAFRDLAIVLPTLGLDPAETLRLRVRTRGSHHRLRTTVDARFNNGGRFDATAQFSPYVTPPTDSLDLRYQIDASWDTLSTSLLAPRNPATNRLSGTLRADLSGPSLNALNGPVRVELSDTRLYGVRTDRLRLEADFQDGTAGLDLRGSVNRAALTVGGFLRPLDDVPTFALNGSASQLDVAAFAPNVGMTSQIATTFQVNGRLPNDQTFNIGIGARLQPSRMGAQSIRSGDVTVRVTPDTLITQADIAFPDGRMDLKGVASLTALKQFRLIRGDLDRAPLLALVGDTTASAVSGTVTASGQGFDAQTMRLDATLAIDTLTYGRYRLQPLRTTLALADGALTSTTEATLNGGAWQFDLNGRPLAATPRLQLTNGRFRNVNVGALVGDTTQTSALNGSLQATLRGTVPETLSLTADVTMDSSRVNRARVVGGRIAAQLRAGTLDTTLDLETPKGTAHVEARAEPFETVPTFALSDGRFEALDVAALAGAPVDTTSLTGTVALTGEGTTLDDLLLTADLALDTSRVNRAAVSAATLGLDVKEGRASVDADVVSEPGRLRLRATVDSLTTRPAYTVDLRADTLDLGTFASRDTVLNARLDTLQWTLEGRGTDPQTLSATTSLRAAGLHTGGIRTQGLRIDGTLEKGLLAVDTVDVASTVALVHGSGTVALFDTTATSQFDLYADATGAAPLRSLVGAQRLSIRRGTAAVHVAGQQGTLAVAGSLKVQDLFYDTMRLGSADVSFDGRGSLAQGLQQWSGMADLSFIATPSVTVQTATVEAASDSGRVDVSGSVQLNPRYSANVDARIDPRSGQQQITLRQLDLRLRADRWSLLQDATITYSDAYRVRGFLLLSEDQQIAADGTIDFDGTQSFIVTAEQVRMAPLAELAGLSGLGGRVTGTLDLTGAASDPQVDTRLQMDVTSEGNDVGALQLSVGYASFNTSIDATLSHVDGGTLDLTGALPMDLRLTRDHDVTVTDRPVGLTIAADGFSVGWIDPFVDPLLLRDIRGTLQAQVDVSGTRQRPSFSGQLSLTDGSAYVPDLDTRYDRATATVDFEGARALLREARIRSDNGGRLQANGGINFSALTLGDFDLNVEARNFIAIDTRAYRKATIDASLTLNGTTRRPVLNGTVNVKRADIYYAEAAGTETTDLASVQLTEEDERVLERRFNVRLAEADTTTFDAYKALAMDLTVEIETDTWIRSEGAPELNIQFTGDLDVTKQTFEDAQVFGSIEVVPERSTIRQFGQEFRLDSGSLTFNGDPTRPYLRATAVYEQRARQSQETEVSITLSLEGRPDDLTPTLSSNPPMETRNILSYLATGQPADQLLSGGGEEGGSLATRVALGQATNFVENLAASQLGLDVVRIRVRTNGTSYLTLGRYFTPRFFASIEQPVTPPTSSTSGTTSPFVPDLTLEYRLNRYLLLRAQNRQQTLQLNVLIERTY